MKNILILTLLLFGTQLSILAEEAKPRSQAEKKIQNSRMVGRIVDVQGLVSIRSVNETRWRPLAFGQLLAPGDWVRCGTRGPNAARIILGGGGNLILGPGTVVECAEPAKLSVLSGEMEITLGEEKPITLACGEISTVFSQPTKLRVADDKLTVLEHEPSWLQGFKGTVVNESMGSLLVNVDGRDVPLTVGYHKVTIDIRDQIARTVIEESFVNHTNSRLEGVFHFPLPADASISEFGMWIGDELVRADVVEKQRAREIYETILRERRDPGLLEWAGGNMFKARVFPIFAHSEKRITITYTQVLPMRDGVYRYTYPLQSDMLRQNPLRELQLTTHISSAAPLKSVECTSHHTRERLTKHAASLEFTAQDYTPTRDFEIAITPKADKSPITIIPHERGEDGYFLMLLNGEGAEAGEQGALEKTGAGSGETLDLVLVADTSGSMDKNQRQNQATFLRTILSSLGPDDRFALLACDVDCIPLTDGLVSPEGAESALEKLNQRDSLGWTNLDNTLAKALEVAPEGAHIIYIGDGIQATSNIDPVETARRLKTLFTTTGPKPSTINHQPALTIHTVATGSAYEAVIMKGMASLGGGSFREMRGLRAPVVAAAELLHELTHPGLRNLAVKFKGIRTARIYPEELPNLAAGMQQVIVGRYLPSSLEEGEITVTGLSGDKAFSFTSPIVLPEPTNNGQQTTDNGQSATGNSFIPRMWARQHLDALLEQGSTPAIRAQIVGFSQEFKIMTPYTSFLVLESDEDRERFGVKRHFKMRDGEAFFADGKASAKYELTRQQMLAAAQWRKNLRRNLLKGLKDLGRDYPAVPQPLYGYGNDIKDQGFHFGGRLSPSISSGIEHFSRIRSAAKSGVFREWKQDASEGFDLNGAVDFDGDRIEEEWNMSFDDVNDVWADKEGEQSLKLNTPMPSLKMEMAESSADYSYIGRQSVANEKSKDSLRLSKKLKPRRSLSIGDYRGDGYVSGMNYLRPTGQTFSPDVMNESWLNPIFPNLPGVSAPQPSKREASLSPEANDLLAGLLRQKRLTLGKENLRFNIVDEYFQPGETKPSVSSETLTIWGQECWLEQIKSANNLLQISWADKTHRGSLDQIFMTARVRDAQTGDIEAGFPAFGDGGKHLLGGDNPTTVVTIQKAEAKYPNALELQFRYQAQKNNFMVLVIDPQRQVLLERQTYNDTLNRLTSTETFAEFVQVAGVWWPTKLVRTDAEGKTTSQKRITLETVSSRVVEKAFADLATLRKKTVELPHPLPLPTRAQKTITAGKGGIGDHISLICHAVSLQKWNDVREYEKALFDQITGLTARPWIDISLLIHSRRNEDARQLIETLASEIADAAKNAPGSDSTIKLSSNLFIETPLGDIKQPRQLVNFANSAMQVNERLALLATLEPLYTMNDVAIEWRRARIQLLQQAGQQDTALAEAKTFYADFPNDTAGIQQLASQLSNVGEHSQAYDLLDNETSEASARTAAIKISLYNHWINLLQNNHSERKLQKDVFERMFILAEAKGQANEYNYRRYLSVLQGLDPEGVYQEQMNQWLNLTADVADLKSQQIQLAKLQSAVQMALGNSINGRTNYLTPEWLPDLVRIVKTCAAKPIYTPIVNQIMSNHLFIRTDEAAALRAIYAQELQGDTTSLDINQLINRTQWIRQSPPAVEQEQWRKILLPMTQRWGKSSAETPTDIAQRHQLGEAILHLTQTYLGLDEALKFSRRRLELATENHLHHLQQKHFNLLTSTRWRKAYEDEAFALLPELSKEEEPVVRETIGIHALMLLTDWMVDAQIEAGLQEEELAGKLQNMDRKTRWQFEKQLEADGRFAALTRLEQAQSQLPDLFQPWIGIEKLHLQTRILNAKNTPAMLKPSGKTASGGLSLSARDVVAELREALGQQAPALFKNSNQLMLFRRRLTLSEFWVAGGRGIDDKTRQDLAVFLVQYCSQALANAPREPETNEQGFTIAPTDWQQVLYDLLVILDQAKPLEQRLQQWVKEADGDAWRIPLAYMLAATDRIGDAIVEMERAESAKLLGPKDYRALSGWYQAVDDRGNHITARRKALEQMPEHILSNRIYQERERSRRRDWNPADGVPPEIDIDTIVDHFVVLFKKSQNPSNYIGQLRDIYQNTRDFRLLRCVPESIVGMSAQQVYPLLNQMSSVLNEIRDEAVVDEFYAAILKIREKSESAVDARALLLLEADIMRRASEVLNQPRQHTPKALKALQAAFKKGDWGPGEERLMAEYLSNLGRISQEPLAVEQRRQLKLLHERAEAGTLTCLQIGAFRARILREYSQWEQAIVLLEAELTAYRQAVGGVFTANANAAMNQLIDYCEGTKRFQHAEKLLLAELERPANRQQWRWLRQRLYRSYNTSIRDKGTTRLGQGAEQYQAVCSQLVKELLSEADHNHAQNLINTQCDIFHSAREVKIATVADDVVRFAMQYFPEMALPAQQYIYNYHSSVGRVAETVQQLASPKAGIAFLLTVAEKEPPSASYGHQGFWGQHAYRLGKWRTETKDLGNLEQPLLDLTCRALRRHLETGQSHRRDMFHNNHSYFWTEKADAFAAVAEKALAEHPDSGKIAYQVGYYFYEGLDRYPRAIEILAAAYQRALLDENAQSYFAQCLTRQGRHAEAVPVLEHLVDWRPDTIAYRTRLMLAYHGAKRPADTERCRAATDKHFRQPKFWNETIAYSLGSACRQCALDTHAVVYFKDAIALRRRALNDRIQNDGQISNYYYELAESYSRLGKTAEAVDAASGAIVCWGRNHDQRRRSVDRLANVLRQAKDLGAYMETVDAESEKTGLENPIIRKAAGQAYDKLGKPELALAQLTRALETQPNDAEIHKLRVNLLQRMKNKDALPAALLAWHRSVPREQDVIRQLQQAYTARELPEQAERASTMLIESQPLEAAAHQALAELRQQQNRWQEAIPHWQRVSELREREPTGLLGLAKAQIHQKQTDNAQQTLQKLLAKDWPERFSNAHSQAKQMLRDTKK